MAVEASTRSDRAARIRARQTLSEIEMLSPAVLAGLAALAALALLEGVGNGSFGFIGLLAIPPVAVAMFAPPTEAIVVSVTAVVLATVAGIADGGLLGADHAPDLLVVVAGGLGAIWIADMRERLEFAKQASDLLADAGTLVVDVLDEKRATRHLAELAVPALADAITIDLLQPDGSIEHELTVGATPQLRDRLLSMRDGYAMRPDSAHPVARAIATGKAQLLPNITREVIAPIAQTGDVDVDEMLRKAPRSGLIAPMRSRGRTLGTMALASYSRQRRYDDDVIRVALTLASRAAITIDNARLHREQVHIAEVLQRNLLPPSLAEVPGTSVGARLLAAGDVNRVGGDFYDLFELGDGSWAAVIGDVCGKGAEAAAVTGLARHTIRAMAPGEPRPSRVLARLSDAMLAERGDLRFCTAALIRVAPSRDGLALTLSNGGHPAPLVLRADGRVERLGSADPLIGALTDVERHDSTAELGPGEVLVLYTDGMLEAAHRAENDPEWIVAALAKCAGMTSEAIADRLTEAALQRQAGDQRDDIAVLAIGMPAVESGSATAGAANGGRRRHAKRTTDVRRLEAKA